MCGRVIQTSNPEAIRKLFDAIAPAPNARPRYNGAPSHDLMVLRRNPETGERTLHLLRWGLIPSWVKDAKGGRRPINARAETIASLPMFKAAYAKRRCLLPIDGYFEWRAIKGSKTKQPYALAMKDRSPFAVAGIWENWTQPDTGEAVRTFAVITCEPNDLVNQIHDRMPVIISPAEYDRWLGTETDPRDLMKPFPSKLMTMWPVSTRVNSPRNDDEGILAEIVMQNANGGE
jgi:putative SOS response-associated peptidase YedK